jgi:hypothetical protein
VKRYLLLKGLAEEPSDDERARHLPRDEATLRSLRLGANTERIVELFKRGELARAVMLEDGQSYCWYDVKGELREHATWNRVGRLNTTFQGKPGSSFLLAYDPSSRAHVIFENCGGARFPAAPVQRGPPPGATPQPIKPLAPADLSSADALVRAAHERFDDLAALQVIADRLCELGEARGELMALQLARGDGKPSHEETRLVRNHAKQWAPHGLDLTSVRFERGVLVEGTCTDAVDATHLAWQTLRALHFQSSFGPHGPSPLNAKLPRLRELTGLNVGSLVPQLENVSQELELLHVNDVDRHWARALMTRLGAYPALRTLGFESTRPGSEPMLVLEHVLSHRPARLAELWLPSYLFNPREVQRALAMVRDLTVNLFFDSMRRDRDAIWIAVTSDTFTLQQRGNPVPRYVELARQTILASEGKR